MTKRFSWFSRVAAAVTMAVMLSVSSASGSDRFLRFEKSPDGRGGMLQTSIVGYENPDGVRVDLIGVVHVADRVYYDVLNERFRQYDSLLFEMIMPAGHDMAMPREQAGGGLNLISGLQRAMQVVLDLEYQVGAIDYGAPNFVHADMDAETFARRQRERGEGFFEMFVRQMMRDMNRDGNRAQPQLSMGEVVEAINAPDRSRRLKLLFARELSNMEDLTRMLEGEEGSVILGERNEVAVQVLDRQIDAGDRQLALFYGAAHMPGIEELIKDRGFVQVGEPEFLVAWDMTPDDSGQRQMRDLLRQTIIESGGERAPAVAGEGEGHREGRGALVEELRALRQELEAVREEMDAVRRQNEALREQNRRLREQNDAVRRQAA